MATRCGRNTLQLVGEQTLNDAVAEAVRAVSESSPRALSQQQQQQRGHVLQPLLPNRLILTLVHYAIGDTTSYYPADSAH